MKLLSIDPGESIGWALFEDAKLADCGIEKYDTRSVWPKHFDLLSTSDVVVYERYFISRVMQDTTTAEVIGALKYMCSLYHIPIIVQEPTVLHFIKSRFFLGKKLKYGSHKLSAISHGMYFLHTRGYDVSNIVKEVIK